MLEKFMLQKFTVFEKTASTNRCSSLRTSMFCSSSEGWHFSFVHAGRLMVFFSHYRPVLNVGNSGEKTHEGGNNGQTVGEARIVDLWLGKPEPIVLEAESGHDYCDRLDDRCRNGDVGHCRHNVERRPSLAHHAGLVVRSGVHPDNDVEDQSQKLDHQ